MKTASFDRNISSAETSYSLIDRVRENDPVAWDQLVRSYGPTVYHWCQRAGVQRADAADICQEVFVTLARALTGFRDDRPSDTFSGWLYVITRNKIYDFFASRLATRERGSFALRACVRLQTDMPEEPQPPAADEQRELCRQTIARIRDQFEAMTWMVFWRVVVDDQPAADVSAELGVSPNAVYLAKSRVLSRLRNEFAALGLLRPVGAFPKPVASVARNGQLRPTLSR